MSEIVQGSPEWFALRLGKVTASRVADVIAKTKTGWGASRSNYMSQLICERLTEAVAPSYVSADMQWGTDHEADARAAYEFRTDATVDLIPFVDHPAIAMTGASPDGLVGSDGMVEFKCPTTATHIETLLSQSIPGKYVTQMQWQMACRPERQWCDYVSFDPRMPEHMSVFIKRVPRDAALITTLEQQVAEFLAELDAKLADLTGIYGKQAA